MESGRTLWDELVHRYDRGVGEVRRMRADWERLAPRVDAERHRQVSAFLRIQEEEAQWWRDASVAYFASISRRPLPPGAAPPRHGLDHYRAIDNRYAPGQ
jgi:alpha-glucuronidase